MKGAVVVVGKSSRRTGVESGRPLSASRQRKRVAREAAVAVAAPSPPAEVSGIYIQQAAAMVGTTSASLRMWEKYELVEPCRTQSGYRVYSLADIERLRQVQQLLQDGVNPAGILKILKDDVKPAPAQRQRHDEARRARTVGDTVRAMRARGELTLRQVSERTGLSPSYISSVERSLASPSIASLQKLATAFGTNVLALMSDSYEAPNTPVVRVAARRTLNSDKGVTIEDLSTAGSNLEPLLFTIQPGAGSDGPLSHEGEEFLYVLSGDVVIRLDGTDDYSLEPGDSMAFESPRHHQFSNVGTRPATVLWINTPRTF
jgi:DNA-binding transcriptional MerR regulator/quercetin dioxygenase-like cupin family protein